MIDVFSTDGRLAAAGRGRAARRPALLSRATPPCCWPGSTSSSASRARGRRWSGRWSGGSTAPTMTRLNALADLEGRSVAPGRRALPGPRGHRRRGARAAGPRAAAPSRSSTWGWWRRRWRWRSWSGVPLGILAARSAALGQVELMAVGVLQTIPALALLCFMIPLLGIGTLPALVALFLYALLPIVRGTYTGLVTLDRRLLEIADVLGLTRLAAAGPDRAAAGLGQRSWPASRPPPSGRSAPPRWRPSSAAAATAR